MWELKKISIKNIVSFKEADFEFRKGLCTLIFGHNEDNAAQPCNGSGKSSLIEAISFALTGEPLRKVKMDEIINDEAEEAFVHLVMENNYDGRMFYITREIVRKGAQVVACQMMNEEGIIIEEDKMVQPTVADYNKMILSEIGLSKDEIYSYFILCENKYKSFFDSSDKDKKEIINRFSNGVMVDESIEKVKEDLLPVSDDLRDANAECSRIKGAVLALEEQLKGADEKNANQKANRDKKVAEYEAKVAELRGKIRETGEQKEKAHVRLNVLKTLLSDIESVNIANHSVDVLNNLISTNIKDNNLPAIKDYKAEAVKYEAQIASIKDNVERIAAKTEVLDKDIDGLSDDYNDQKAVYDRAVESHNNISKSESKKLQEIQDEIKAIDQKLDGFDTQLKDYENTKKDLQRHIAQLGNILHGTITCPNCSHRFILSTDGRSLEDVEKEKSETEGKVLELDRKVGVINKEYDKLDAQAAKKEDEAKVYQNSKQEREKKLADDYELLKSVKRNLDGLIDGRNHYQNELNVCKNELERITGKIENVCQRMIGEYVGILEGQISKGEGYVNGLDENVKFYEGQIAQYLDAKKNLENMTFTDFTLQLKESIAKYGDELGVAEKKAADIQEWYDELNGQLTNFNMFKSYLANKKLDALSYIVNDFLEQIGSDIRLRLEGFKVLKTGKLKENISIQVLRDGVDIGSYYKRSGGERARLNLASILALQKLTNGNCEEGKGLDIIICDEVLDKSDEVGIMSYCEALNKLHQTSLIITQNQVTEGYPNKVVITKSKGFSRIG